MGLFGVTEDTLQYRLLLPQMEINRFKILNIYTETISDDNSRIGSKILEYGIITIDYKNKKFYFIPSEENDIDASEKNFPIDFVPRNNQLYVGFVWDNNISDRISYGDQVVAIDDISYHNVNICDIITKDAILKNKSTVKISTLNQKGEKVETVIKRK